MSRRWIVRRIGPAWAGRYTEHLPSWDGLGDVFNFDLGIQSVALLLIGLILLVFVVVPLLLLGVELLIAGCLIGAALIGRLLLLRPWVVVARTLGSGDSVRVLEWEVSGWRRSQKLIDQISADLAHGREPTRGTITASR